jgi:hypothetical protein
LPTWSSSAGKYQKLPATGWKDGKISNKFIGECAMSPVAISEPVSLSLHAGGYSPMTQLLEPHQLEDYRTKLDELRLEHRDLDDVISRLSEDPHMDQLQLRRMKKRKLYLKDLITRLESKLIPDIDA